VDRPNQVQSLVARRHPGDRLAMRVRRGGKDVTVNATLGMIPENGRMTSAAPEQEDGGSAVELGLTVHDVTPEIADRFSLETDADGVVVLNVGRGPARDAGFRPGDLIFAVRQGAFDATIDSVDNFREALGQLKKGVAAAFSVMRRTRRGEERFLFITPRIPN